MECAFSWLEQHLSGSLLDSVETVLHFAKTLTFKRNHPVMTLVEKVYKTGVKLTKQAMVEVKRQLQCQEVLCENLWEVGLAIGSIFLWNTLTSLVQIRIRYVFSLR